MRGKKLILVKGVYSLEKWTKPNPLMSTENRPVDISSVFANAQKKGWLKHKPSPWEMYNFGIILNG